MGTKLRKLTLPVLLAGLAAVLMAPAADASRTNEPPTATTEPLYAPPPRYGQNPFPEIESEPDPYEARDVTPMVVPVDLGGSVTDPRGANDPGADPAGSGQELSPAPADTGPAPKVPSESETRPVVRPAKGGVFANTGAETLPLARAGLAALTLGAGLVVLGRRRRQAEASA
jgi:hypothetical protein